MISAIYYDLLSMLRELVNYVSTMMAVSPDIAKDTDMQSTRNG